MDRRGDIRHTPSPRQSMQGQRQQAKLAEHVHFDEVDRKWRFWDPKPSQKDAKSKPFADYTKRDFTGSKRTVNSVAWNSSGDCLAAGSEDRDVCIWKLESTKPMAELKGHSGPVKKARWSPINSNMLATASNDGTMKIWDVRTGRAASSVGTKAAAECMSWSPKGNYIAVGNAKDVTMVFDVRRSAGSATIASYPASRMVYDVEWDRSERFLLLASNAGTVDVVKFPDMKKVHVIRAHSQYCYCVEVGRNGRYIATGGADSLVQLWDTRNLVSLKVFTRLGAQIRGLGISADSKYVASCCFVDDGQKEPESRVDISDTGTGQSVHTVTSSAVFDTLSWSPTQRVLAVGGKMRNGRSDTGVVSVYRPR